MSLAMNTAVPFPDTQPEGYEWLHDEPIFDPAVHLHLEMPTELLTLAELGYEQSEIDRKATPFAVSSPFRILSDIGAQVMLDSCRRLKEFHRRAGDRIERVVRGGCYRSKFLRDVCISTDLTAHMSRIYGIAAAPHPMTLHLGHLNYEPTTLGENVDKWHHDTIAMDFVMMVTDPTTLSGGQFEWFRGTKHEVAELAKAGEPLPADRVVKPSFPSAGYAIALHGDMVVHRAAALTEPGERITLVNGYVAMDTATDEQSRSADLIIVDDHDVLFAEWAKFVAWRSAGRLTSVIDALPFGTDAETAAAALEDAIADAQAAAAQMRAGVKPADHYEQ